MESVKLVVRGRIDQEIEVHHISLEGISKLGGILSNGHFAISAKDNIWVVVLTHQIAIIVRNLVNWREIIRIVITTISLVI